MSAPDNYRPRNPVVIIPARLASARLPGKPLADIHGEAMIVHVWRRARDADLGPVVVAAAEPEIADAVRRAGGEAVLTDPGLPSGSDRVHAALAEIDPGGEFDAVLNLQGDLPAIDPAVIGRVFAPLADAAVDIATLASVIADEAEAGDANTVKAVISLLPGQTIGRALYFSRNAVPSGDGPLYHHIGIYAFRPAALERFVALPPAPLENRERLEQLRALEDGMRIDVALVDSVPFGVDTAADLERARRILAPPGQSEQNSR